MGKIVWISLLVIIVLVALGYFLYPADDVPPGPGPFESSAITYGQISLFRSTTEPCVLEDVLIYSRPDATSEVVYILEKTEELCNEGINVDIDDIQGDYYKVKLTEPKYDGVESWVSNYFVEPEI
jgi:hypothetical protein